MRTAYPGLLGLALGVSLGLLVGWVLWPVQYTNTAPPNSARITEPITS